MQIDPVTASELERQLTAELYQQLQRSARPRAHAVACAGRKLDINAYSSDLVQDAIGDTWVGVLGWDPARCSLKHHLLRAIRTRAKWHRQQAMRRPHDVLFDNTVRSHEAEKLASEILGTSHAINRVFSRESISRLRSLAAKDKRVLALLDAYDAGATTKSDVLELTKMRDATYHKAYVRLRRHVRSLVRATSSSAPTRVFPTLRPPDTPQHR